MLTSLSLQRAGIDIETLRTMYGAEPCESCRTHVVTMNVVDDDDRPTGDRVLAEVETIAKFGAMHSVERCRAARA